MTVHVRWPAKNSGAFVFGCTFLWSFLLCKQKKGQAACIKTKKRKELKNILYRFEERGMKKEGTLQQRRNIYSPNSFLTTSAAKSTSFSVLKIWQEKRIPLNHCL